MKAILTVAGVGDKAVTIGLPSPYCPTDGVINQLPEKDRKKGFDAVINLPDGVRLLNTIKHTDGGFWVSIQEAPWR